MALYRYELSLEFQLRVEAEIDKIEAAIAGVFAAVFSIAAAALSAAARSLAAAAAAAKRQAAAAVAKYNADLRAYQAQRRAASKPKKPNLAAFRHDLHCLFDPGALYTRACAKVYKDTLAIGKQIAKCDQNGATAKDCKQIWQVEEEVAAATTHCTNTGGTQVCNTNNPTIVEGNGSVVFDLLRIGAEFLSGVCDAVTDGACTAATVIISLSNAAIDASK
jgi:hypothetical protein